MAGQSVHCTKTLGEWTYEGCTLIWALLTKLWNLNWNFISLEKNRLVIGQQSSQKVGGGGPGEITQ